MLGTMRERDRTFRHITEKMGGDGVVYHYVEGVVYAPLEVDTHFETMTAADIEEMAHDFIASGRVGQIDVMHDELPSGAKVVESWIVRKGDDDYPEGAWVLRTRIPDGPLWEAIKSGKLNGYSFQALVNKVPKKVLVDIARIAEGETEENTEEEVERHRHEYYVEFDRDGRVTMGLTTNVLGHAHRITGTVVTETEAGHNHRFFV